MTKYIDFRLVQGDYGKAAEYYDENAIALAIRNILLSRPGNFPFNPSIGMDIRQYQFDILDSQTVSNIQKELNKQISKLIPELGDVSVVVQKVKDDNDMYYLCFSISASTNGKELSTDLILANNTTTSTIDVYTETY